MILSCPFCKAKADPAAVQCASCGKTMSRACPACAETIASNATSCKYCGEAVPAMKEPQPLTKSHPGIVFLEEKPRRSCCGSGRSMFWILVLALAGYCAYSAVKTGMICHRGRMERQQIQEKLKQQQQAPAPAPDKGEYH